MSPLLLNLILSLPPHPSLSSSWSSVDWVRSISRTGRRTPAWSTAQVKATWCGGSGRRWRPSVKRGEDASCSLSRAPPGSHYKASRRCRVGHALAQKPHTHTVLTSVMVFIWCIRLNICSAWGHFTYQTRIYRTEMCTDTYRLRLGQLKCIFFFENQLIVLLITENQLILLVNFDLMWAFTV